MNILEKARAAHRVAEEIEAEERLKKQTAHDQYARRQADSLLGITLPEPVDWDLLLYDIGEGYYLSWVTDNRAGIPVSSPFRHSFWLAKRCPTCDKLVYTVEPIKHLEDIGAAVESRATGFGTTMSHGCHIKIGAWYSRG